MRWVLPVLIACAPGSSDLKRGDPGDAPGSIAVDAQPAFDPLRGELAWSVSGMAGLPVTVAVLDGDAELWSTEGTLSGSGALTGTWAPDQAPQAGLLTVRATQGRLQATDDFAVVRPGLSAARFDDPDRLPLYWRGGQQLQDAAAPVATSSDVERFPEVSEDIVAAPDDGTSEPVAYAFDARPQLTLTVPQATDLGGTGLEHATVEVSLEGWAAVGDARMTPGGSVTLQLEEPLSDTVGLTDVDLDLVFYAVDGQDRFEIGHQSLPVRIYRLLGPQTTGFDTDDANPWVAAIDPALRAIDGTPAQPDPVVDALVEWIYRDLGLVYDTAAGASFYSEYGGFSWDEPHFFLSDFLVRRNGDVVNCSDSGNILATHANMLGAELVHLVILQNFQLNEIQAIGHTTFTSCPFGPWGCGFSYHAVTTSSVTADTIWDTTLALDGDSDPGSSPSVELLVQSIPGPEYLDRLVRSGSAGYDFPARITFE